jgi:hypothetical protein
MTERRQRSDGEYRAATPWFDGGDAHMQMQNRTVGEAAGMWDISRAVVNGASADRARQKGHKYTPQASGPKHIYQILIK